MSTRAMTWETLTEYAALFHLDQERFAVLKDFFEKCDKGFFEQCASSIPENFPMQLVRERFTEEEKAKFLFLCCVSNYYTMKDLYDSEGWPLQMFEEMTHDLSIWAGTMTRDFGFYGLTERIFDWVTACIRGSVKSYGRLQGNDIHSFGPAKSIYCNDDGSIEVCKAFERTNRPSPDLTKFDKCINIHIPASGPLTREACLDSLRRMCEFSAEFHPDFDYKAIVCYSWILDPAFQKILKSSSNIRQFQDLGHIFTLPYDETKEVIWRIWGKKGVDTPLEDLPRNSSMEKAVAEYLQNGGKFSEGVLVILRSELPALLGQTC